MSQEREHDFHMSQHASTLLTVAGYERVSHPATWRDIGGSKNGPKIIGGPAYDEYLRADHYIIVQDGVVEVDGFIDSSFDDIPF